MGDDVTRYEEGHETKYETEDVMAHGLWTTLGQAGSERFERWPTQYQVWLSKRQRVLRELDTPVPDGELVVAG